MRRRALTLLAVLAAGEANALSCVAWPDSILDATRMHRAQAGALVAMTGHFEQLGPYATVIEPWGKPLRAPFRFVGTDVATGEPRSVDVAVTSWCWLSGYPCEPAKPDLSGERLQLMIPAADGTFGYTEGPCPSGTAWPLVPSGDEATASPETLMKLHDLLREEL